MGESSRGKKGPEAGAGFLEAEAGGAESGEAEASGAETTELGFFISATSEHRGSAANTPPSGNLSG